MKILNSLSLQGNYEDHAVETVGLEAQQRIPASRDNIVSLESVDTYEAGRATNTIFFFVKKTILFCSSQQLPHVSKGFFSLHCALQVP